METIESLEKSVNMHDETINKLVASDEETRLVKDPVTVSINIFEDEKIKPLKAHDSEMETMVKGDYRTSCKDDFKFFFSTLCSHANW